MMWFITRRRHEAETGRLLGRVLAAEEERVRLTRRLADEDIANRRLAEEFAAVSIVNGRLTEDLTAARERLAAAVGPVEGHDVHRKALADALGVSEPGPGWDLLIAEARGLRQSAGLQAVIDATQARQTRARDEESRPMDGGSVGPRSLASELLREKGRANALAARVAELTAANQTCTCAGGEQP